MIKLLIIADDFTGALDTGVQFAACGAISRVVTDTRYNYSEADPDVRVLVLDAETRHLSPEDAYKIVFRIVRSACTAGIPHIYKKTDSALRGNIGSELTALMEGAKSDKVVFIPAYPKMGRVTVNGIHYVDGKPVAESIFGQDAFEPVLFSDVSQIISAQSDVPVAFHPGLPDQNGEECPGIQLFDAETNKTMWDIASGLGAKGLRLMAGCAGFAAVLPEMLSLGGNAPRLPQMAPELFVICGSVNPVTRAQLNNAEKSGFLRIRLTLTQKLDSAWLDSINCTQTIFQWQQLIESNHCCILDTNDAEGCQDTKNFARLSGFNKAKLRATITSALGELSKRFLDGGLDATLMLIGGDTMMGVMQTFGVSELVMFCEVAPGVVLSQFTYQNKKYNVISKAGGFGEPNLLNELAIFTGAAQKREDTICLKHTI